MPAWPVPPIVPEPIEGGPVFGCFGHVNESKRMPQLLEAFARLGPDARLLLVGSWSPRLPADRAAAERDPPRLRPRGRAVAAARRLRRGRLAALADDGRDLRRRRSGALGGQAAGRQRRRRVPRASRRGRDQGAGRRGRGRRRWSHAMRRRGRQRGDERGARGALPETEHRLDRTADLYAEALRAAAPAVAA